MIEYIRKDIIFNLKVTLYIKGHRGHDTQQDYEIMNKEKEIKKYAKVLWGFIKLNHKLKKVDCIMGFGNKDTETAKKAAELFLLNYAPLIVFTGGFGRLTPKEWKISEAKTFFNIATSMDVPSEKIILEEKSTTTWENIEFTRELLNKRGIIPKKMIVIVSPYLQRRTFLTFKKKWPELEVVMVSSVDRFDDYIKISQTPKRELINFLVGEIYRLIEYPKRKWLENQKIPKNVMEAYNFLTNSGFTKYFIKLDE